MNASIVSLNATTTYGNITLTPALLADNDALKAEVVKILGRTCTHATIGTKCAKMLLGNKVYQPALALVYVNVGASTQPAGKKAATKQAQKPASTVATKPAASTATPALVSVSTFPSTHSLVPTARKMDKVMSPKSGKLLARFSVLTQALKHNRPDCFVAALAGLNMTAMPAVTQGTDADDVTIVYLNAAGERITLAEAKRQSTQPPVNAPATQEAKSKAGKKNAAKVAAAAPVPAVKSITTGQNLPTFQSLAPAVKRMVRQCANAAGHGDVSKAIVSLTVAGILK